MFDTEGKEVEITTRERVAMQFSGKKKPEWTSEAMTIALQRYIAIADSQVAVREDELAILRNTLAYLQTSIRTPERRLEVIGACLNIMFMMGNAHMRLHEAAVKQNAFHKLCHELEELTTITMYLDLIPWAK